jgi:hypothetical protein
MGNRQGGKNGAAGTPGKQPKATGNKANNSAAKIAQVVGAGKAKRAALQAQKRGLNATGKATKMEIDNAIQKQNAKKANNGGNNNAQQGKRLKNKKALLKKGGNNGPKTGGATGLKISFNTADLARTTDKLVALQVSFFVVSDSKTYVLARSKALWPSKRPAQ